MKFHTSGVAGLNTDIRDLTVEPKSNLTLYPIWDIFLK
jgi:hypothetical protein